MNISLDPIALTQTLIGFDTINPPGNERPCAEHLGRLLEGAGFSISYHEFAERRTSLVARLGRSPDCPPLCFTGHIDTVPLGPRLGRSTPSPVKFPTASSTVEVPPT